MAAIRKERRRSLRVKRRFNANFEVGGKALQGIAMHFSKHGFFLQTRHLVPVKTGIKVHISIGTGTFIEVSGRIASSRQDRLFATSGSSGGIGVELVSAPTDYYDFLDEANS